MLNSLLFIIYKEYTYNNNIPKQKKSICEL